MAKILMVDDDSDVTMACRIVLEDAGHECLAAHNRQDGMAAVEEFKPDVLILDVMMGQPDDGIVMAQQLRREGFIKPILMLTGIHQASGMPFAQDDEIIPVDELLEKPVAPPTILASVNKLLAKEE